jgi:hypothetical protein
VKAEVLVIGAGPYGFAVAGELARRGVNAVAAGSPFATWHAHTFDGLRLARTAAPALSGRRTAAGAWRGFPLPREANRMVMRELDLELGEFADEWKLRRGDLVTIALPGDYSTPRPAPEPAVGAVERIAGAPWTQDLRSGMSGFSRGSRW